MLLVRRLMIRKVLPLVTLATFSFNLWAIPLRNEAERFRLLHDKFKNDDLYRPFGHDFLLDATAHMADGVMDFIDDADTAANATGTDVEKAQKVNDFLEKHKNESFYANARVAAGIPLPTFDFDTWKLAIDLRGAYELGASASITETRNQTFEIAGRSWTVADPIVQLYAVETIRYGAYSKWMWGENWWMQTDFYIKQRWDRHDVLTSTTILNDKSSFDLDRPKNITATLDHNFRLGYDQESGLRWWAGVDEVKFSKLSDRVKETGRKVGWGDRPVVRGNVDYAVDLSAVRLTPYTGFHSRSNYDLEDGIYLGLLTEENLLGIVSASIMYDNEFLTFNPKLDLWIFHLDYALKSPVDSDVDGYKTHTTHAANLRIAF